MYFFIGGIPLWFCKFTRIKIMQQSITTQFNIGISTVMVGPMEEVLRLTPDGEMGANHSIGLIKNFSLSSETSEVTLTQGLRNTQVDSQVTGVTTQLTMEVYEYTAKNLAYAAQLKGEDFNLTGTYELASPVTGGTSATSITLAGAADHFGDFQPGTIVAIQSTSDKKYDKVYLAQISTAPTAPAEGDTDVSLTLTTAIPADWSFAKGDKVFVVNMIPVGSDEAQPYYGVKIVGVLPNGNEPVTIVCPKAKVTAGFTLGFTTDNYGNMPFQITPYDLTADDLKKFSDADREILKKYNANLFVFKN